MNQAEAGRHPAFAHLGTRQLQGRGIRLEEFRHTATSALHLHFAADHPESVFMVAFRTLPQDSTGVAHILEHTVLCGSQKYPVRDPFFLMLRRSLNSFMNAFTGSDFTAYPFASQNRQDFCNLMDVYLDAVFFPNLDARDFGQEGHHLAFAEPDNPESPLIQLGVVYNEMKGDASSPLSLAHEAMQSHLHPSSSYHFNSGGEPQEIVRLTRDQLLDFHQLHYHPGNAVFMTFGRQPAAEHQERFEQRVLGRLQTAGRPLRCQPEQRFTRPVQAEVPCPAKAGGEDGQLLLGWLLGPGRDPQQLLEASLLSELLLGTSASPLKRALEGTRLAKSVSPLCGLETDNFEMSFVCGLEGLAPGQADAAEKLILDTLADIAAEGFTRAELDAALHQLELRKREPAGTYPLGLELMLEALPAVMHHGDPFCRLDLSASLALAAKAAAEPHRIQELLRELLLDNPHRVRLLMRPDPSYEQNQVREEAARLAGIRENLSAEERGRIIRFAESVRVRQEEEPDLSCLPKVGLAEIPDSADLPKGQSLALAGGNLCRGYAATTNGLVYLQTLFPLPQLQEESRDCLPLLTLLLGELGMAGKDYLAVQEEISRLTGGIHASTSLCSSLDDLMQHQGFLAVSGKALTRNLQPLARLIQETLTLTDFTDSGRILTLLQQARTERDAAVTAKGHSLAMTAAASGLSPLAAARHKQSGLEGLLSLRSLADQLSKGAGMRQLQDKLAALYSQLTSAPGQHFVAADAADLALAGEALSSLWCSLRSGPVSAAEPAEVSAGEWIPQNRQQIWVAESMVNFCSLAFPTVPESHADSAPLAVLAGVMTNLSLHRLIREQGGAYGAGASHDAENGIFYLYSYRDPGFAATCASFQRAIDEVQQQAVSFAKTEESILGLIASLDAPGSPAAEAARAFQDSLHGRDEVQKNLTRKRLLQVTPDEVQRVAGIYLRPEKTSRGFLVSEASLPEAETLNAEFEIRRI